MRIGRGIFRLWVVASVLWVLFVGIMTWQKWPLDYWTIPGEGPVFALDAPITPLPEFAGKCIWRRSSAMPL